MPRPKYKVPYQPRNKPQGGGVPIEEGRAVDLRISVGAYMSCVLESLADTEGISVSAYTRNLIREKLTDMGIVFR